MSLLPDTDRLQFRDWHPDHDALSACEMYCDPEVMRFLSSGKPDPDLGAVKRRLQNAINRYGSRGDGSGCWAIIEQLTQQLVGSVLLIPLPGMDNQPTADYEIGWHLRRASWGQGYATEAARSVIDYGFHTLGLPELYAVVKPCNERSLRVTQRLGMKPLGRTRQYYAGIELELFRLQAQPG